MSISVFLLDEWCSPNAYSLDIFDEYTRRQYQAKAPRRNPFGDDEEPNKFADFDVFTKVRVLHQLSIWTLNNPNPIRERMAEADETEWRMEPLGWDADDREYYVLDDDRLYRRTAPPLPPEPKPKVKAKPKPKRNTRSNKRRRVSRAVPDTTPEETEQEQEVNGADGVEERKKEPEDEYAKFGGFTWKLIAITLEEYQAFIDTIRKSRDPNEKELRKRLESQVLPVIEQRAEERAREAQRRDKELLNMQKLATAKRSSRIADKMEKQKAVEEAEAQERKRLADLEMAHREQDRQIKLDSERQSRMMTREQRIREREVKRILQEEQLEKEKEQLARLEDQGKIADAERARISERKLKADMQRRQKELEQLQQQEDDWFFDCSVCGLHGQNLDDGSHSIACEKCNVWQHSACHGITQEQAERDDFHFLCRDCKRKMENPIPPLKLRFGSSASPPSAERPHKPKVAVGVEIPPKPKAPKKIPNGVNMSSVHHYTPPGYRPPSAGSSTINGTLPPAQASPMKLASPLVYPGPPPKPPIGTSPPLLPSPHHAYPIQHSPSPPRPSSSGYTNGSRMANGYPSARSQANPNPYYGPNGVPRQAYPGPSYSTYQQPSYASYQMPRSPYQPPYASQQSPPPHHASPTLHQQQQQYYRPPSQPAPAYSPHKAQSSPAPPSSSPSLNGHLGYQPLNAPPTLSPSTAPPILSPPVKKTSPSFARIDVPAAVTSPAPQPQLQSPPQQNQLQRPAQQSPIKQSMPPQSPIKQSMPQPLPAQQPPVQVPPAPQPPPQPTIPGPSQLLTPSSSMIAAPVAPQAALVPSVAAAGSEAQSGNSGSA